MEQEIYKLINRLFEKEQAADIESRLRTIMGYGLLRRLKVILTVQEFDTIADLLKQNKFDEIEVLIKSKDIDMKKLMAEITAEISDKVVRNLDL